VLIVPDIRLPMHWQAATGVPASMVGGGDTTEPAPNGQATSYIYNRRVTARYLYALWLGSTGGRAPSPAQISADLAYWGLAAIVAVTGQDSPLARFLTAEFGSPTAGLGGVLAWRQPQLRSQQQQRSQPHHRSTVNTAKKGK
jgi:hypothetical protein